MRYIIDEPVRCILEGHSLLERFISELQTEVSTVKVSGISGESRESEKETNPSTRLDAR